MVSKKSAHFEPMQEMKPKKNVELDQKHIILICLIIVSCFTAIAILSRIPPTQIPSIRASQEVPENCTFQFTTKIKNCYEESLTFETEQCDLLYVRVFPYTILTYCYDSNKTETLTLYDKASTRKILWKTQHLIKVREFLKATFENFQNKIESAGDNYHRMDPLIRLRYSKDHVLQYALINDTMYLSHYAVYSLYKLLCY